MTVELNDLVGNWQATRDVSTCMGFGVFTIPKGSIVTVKKQDNRNIEKALGFNEKSMRL